MRFVTRSALTLAALSFTASAAEAATTDANRSRGSADLSWSTRKPITGPASNKIGGSALQIEFSVDLDPVKDVSKPMLAVDMKDVGVEAVWTDDQTIDLVLADSNSNDGKLTVHHTLAPHIKLYIDIGLKFTYDYNAQSLLNAIPGSNWNYLGTGTAGFAPWAMTNYGIVKVQGPSLNNAQLFSLPLENILGSGSTDKLQGQLAFNATTEPTFNYATTEVRLDGTPLTKEKSVSTIPTTDADYLDLPMMVKGQLTYEGTIYARPSVTITKIGNISIPGSGLTLEIGAASVDLPYSSDTTPIPVDFQAVMVHIPLPNVKAAKTLDFGSAMIGKETSKQAAIKNTGEMEAVLSIKSSNPQFKVTSDKIMAAKTDLDLEITFTPTEEGEQSAEITVTSNDPNEPVQVIKVTGVGSKVTVPSGDGDEESETGAASGCGCRTAPTQSSYAAFGAFGLALAAILRRRRR